MPGVYGGDEINAIVLDPGTSLFRGGWAGEDQPRALFPSHYGGLPLSDADRAQAGASAPSANGAADDGDVSMAEAGEELAKPKLPRGVSLDVARGRKRFVGDAGVSYWRPNLEIDTPFDADGIGAYRWARLTGSAGRVGV